MASDLFTCRNCGREIYLKTEDGRSLWWHKDGGGYKHMCAPARLPAETVPEMGRRIAQGRAAAHKRNFLIRCKDELDICESEADIMALIERIYEELHG